MCRVCCNAFTSCLELMFAVELFMSKNPTKLWFIILLQKHTVHVAQDFSGVGVTAPEQGRKFYIKAALGIIFPLSFWNFCIKSTEKENILGQN